MNEEQLRMVARGAAGKPCPWCGKSAKYVTNDDTAQVLRNAVRSVLSGILVVESGERHRHRGKWAVRDL